MTVILGFFRGRCMFVHIFSDNFIQKIHTTLKELIMYEKINNIEMLITFKS